MKGKYSANFMVGALLGTLTCLLFWYWQKSTRAEDGALDLLDRLKMAEGRLRQASETPQRPLPSQTAVADDLEAVKGIGPVFAQRLQAAGVQTFAQLAQQSVAQLSAILYIREGRAENILAEAQQFV